MEKIRGLSEGERAALRANDGLTYYVRCCGFPYYPMPEPNILERSSWTVRDLLGLFLDADKKQQLFARNQTDLYGRIDEYFSHAAAVVPILRYYLAYRFSAPPADFRAGLWEAESHLEQAHLIDVETHEVLFPSDVERFILARYNPLKR